MGAFDRFRKLERPRPERGGPPPVPDDSVEGRFSGPEIPPSPADSRPFNCAKCGGDNPARSATCFNCGSDLDTPEMHAHQEAWRVRQAEAQKRALEHREARKQQALAAADAELARARTKATHSGDLTPSAMNDSWPSSTPLGWLLRAAGKIEDPGLRLGLQIALVGAVVALMGYGLSSPNRYGLLVVGGILLGSTSGRYYRRRRWWW